MLSSFLVFIALLSGSSALDCCIFSDRLAADIPGIGYGEIQASCISECQQACCDDTFCQAVQYNSNANRCLFHDNQLTTSGRPQGWDLFFRNSQSCKQMCYVQIPADVFGAGLKQLGTDTLNGCVGACTADPTCAAFQYSESSVLGPDFRCLLHTIPSVPDNTFLFEDFFSYMPVPCGNLDCYSDALPIDIASAGYQQAGGAFEQCRLFCSGDPTCIAFQYSDTDQACFVHNNPVSQVDGVSLPQAVPFFTYFLGGGASCTDCCYSEPVTTDIPGFGFMTLFTDSLAGCQSACCASPACNAIQYSESIPENPNQRCALHKSQGLQTNSGPSSYLTYLTSKVPCGDQNCIANTAPGADIGGLGYAQIAASSMDACFSICCASEKCQAVQFSATCAFFGCNQNCFLHESQATYIPTDPTSIGDFEVRLKVPQQESNNKQSGARDLSPNGIGQVGSTVDATPDFDLPTCSETPTSPGVFYKVAGNGQTMMATTCSSSTDFDTIIDVYTQNCENGGFVCVAGNDDDDLCPWGDELSSVSFSTVVGETYIVHVHGFEVVGTFEIRLDYNGGQSGCTTVPMGDSDIPGLGFAQLDNIPNAQACYDACCSDQSCVGIQYNQAITFCVLHNSQGIIPGAPDGYETTYIISNPVPNDGCTQAVPLTLGQQMSGSTTFALTDPPSTCDGFRDVTPGVWYTIQGQNSGLLVTTCTDLVGYDTSIAVYTGNCGNLVCVAHNDDDQDGCSQGNSQSSFLTTVRFYGFQGVTYYVYVNGFAESGDFNLLAELITDPVQNSCQDCFFEHETPECGVQTVNDCVCLSIPDNFCCGYDAGWWDEFCTTEAIDNCSGACGGEGPPVAPCNQYFTCDTCTGAGLECAYRPGIFGAPCTSTPCAEAEVCFDSVADCNSCGNCFQTVGEPQCNIPEMTDCVCNGIGDTFCCGEFEGSWDNNCVLEAASEACAGNCFSPTIVPTPAPEPDIPEDPKCAFATGVRFDINGVGYRQYITNAPSLDKCKNECCREQQCKAIQYSATPTDENFRCILHANAVLSDDQPAGYFSYVLDRREEPENGSGNDAVSVISTDGQQAPQNGNSATGNAAVVQAGKGSLIEANGASNGLSSGANGIKASGPSRIEASGIESSGASGASGIESNGANDPNVAEGVQIESASSSAGTRTSAEQKLP